MSEVKKIATRESYGNALVELGKEHEDLIKKIANALGDKVQSVRISHRLTSTPSCVVTDANGMSSHMARLMQAAGQKVPEQKFILEINPGHALVQQLGHMADESIFTEWSLLLLEQAQLAEQGGLSDPASFVARLNRLLSVTTC